MDVQPAEIQVLLFGPAQRIAGQSCITVRVDGQVTCLDVKRALVAAAPRMTDFIAGARLAVNRKLLSDTGAVRPGDEVALIGMVSGG
jgi:molybdopterin converting factor small subunit